MEIAVLGGGHGCYAAAADLTDQGHTIRLWRRDEKNFAPVLESGAITLTDTKGTRDVPIGLPTTDLAAAMDGAELILIPLPATAQADLAQQLETRMANLTRQFQEETGLGEDSELLTQFSSATKAVTNQTLNGVRTARDKLLSEKGIYRAYVLMDLPLGKANQLLMDKIQSKQHLYTRFRATQAFEELDKELQSFAKQEER